MQREGLVFEGESLFNPLGRCSLSSHSSPSPHCTVALKWQDCHTAMCERVDSRFPLGVIPCNYLSRTELRQLNDAMPIFDYYAFGTTCNIL